MVTPLYSGGYLPVIIIILPYGRRLHPLRGQLPRWAMIRLVLHSRVSCDLVLEHDVVVSPTTPMIIIVGIYVCVVYSWFLLYSVDAVVYLADAKEIHIGCNRCVVWSCCKCEYMRHFYSRKQFKTTGIQSCIFRNPPFLPLMVSE